MDQPGETDGPHLCRMDTGATGKPLQASKLPCDFWLNHFVLKCRLGAALAEGLDEEEGPRQSCVLHRGDCQGEQSVGSV